MQLFVLTLIVSVAAKISSCSHVVPKIERTNAAQFLKGEYQRKAIESFNNPESAEFEYAVDFDEKDKEEPAFTLTITSTVTSIHIDYSPKGGERNITVCPNGEYGQKSTAPNNNQASSEREHTIEIAEQDNTIKPQFTPVVDYPSKPSPYYNDSSDDSGNEFGQNVNESSLTNLLFPDVVDLKPHKPSRPLYTWGGISSVKPSPYYNGSSFTNGKNQINGLTNQSGQDGLFNNKARPGQTEVADFKIQNPEKPSMPSWLTSAPASITTPPSPDHVLSELESTVNKFLKSEYEHKATESCNKQVTEEWEHIVDIDDKEKAESSINATLEGAKLEKMYWKKYFRELDPSHFKDINLKRQISRLSILGNSALCDDKLAKLSSIINSMTTIYSTAKICPYEKQDCCLEDEGLSLEPDLDNLMAESRNYEKLVYVWKAWRDATGSKMKDMYYDYVKLSNEAASENTVTRYAYSLGMHISNTHLVVLDFTDKGEMWRQEFESKNFEKDLDKLWMDVKPLYNELHEYVLRKLKCLYPTQISEDETLIPAHILGNMWAQNWINIAPLVMPYKNVSTIDVTKALIDKNYTVLRMFETADNFYTSLGLESNAMCYNVSAGAMIEKPEDRNVVCHASAWDFCNGKDFRIKMCAEVNFENFVIIHHEMGHIQYYQLYKNQPYLFRNGANPGFHEAIGDTIALSVTTPEHLYKIGLLDEQPDCMADSLNALMSMALERVAFLPYGYLTDKWRWEVFNEKIGPENWNERWWHYRENIQRVKAPVSRSDENDFDPGAKFHIAADSQYISYFFAHILEFQLHKYLCIAAGEYQEGGGKKYLHECDIYKSKAAGKKLRLGLSLGASIHWTKVLQKMTGQKKLSGTALMEYFQPLMTFLQDENDKSSELEK